MKFSKKYINYKNSSKILSPEYYSTNQLYSITINPSDAMQYWDSDNLISRTISFLKDVLPIFKKKILLNIPHELYIEHSKGSRIHVHGWFQFKNYNDILPFLGIINEYIRDDSIQVEIDSIKDFWIWYIYCTKQQHIIKPLINKCRRLSINPLDYK